MEGIFEGDDAAFLVAKVVVGIFTRQLQRRFIRFGSGVTEEHFFGEGGVDQFFRQAQRGFVGVAVAGMPELRRLVVQRLTQRWMRVTQGVNRNPPGKVDVLFTLLIPQA